MLKDQGVAPAFGEFSANVGLQFALYVALDRPPFLEIEPTRLSAPPKLAQVGRIVLLSFLQHFGVQHLEVLFDGAKVAERQCFPLVVGCRDLDLVGAGPVPVMVFQEQQKTGNRHGKMLIILQRFADRIRSQRQNVGSVAGSLRNGAQNFGQSSLGHVLIQASARQGDHIHGQMGEGMFERPGKMADDLQFLRRPPEVVRAGLVFGLPARRHHPGGTPEIIDGRNLLRKMVQAAVGLQDRRGCIVQSFAIRVGVEIDHGRPGQLADRFQQLGVLFDPLRLGNKDKSRCGPLEVARLAPHLR